MVHQEILDFIRKRRAALLMREQIEKELASGGWSAADIAEGFAAIEHTPGSAVSAAIAAISAVSAAPIRRKTIFSPFFTSLVLLRRQWWMLTVLILIASLFSLLVFIGNALTYIFVWGALAFVGLFVLNIIVGWRLLAAMVYGLVSGERLGIRSAWCASKGKSLRLFGICVAYMLIVLGGTLLFIIPGLVFATLFLFAPYIYIVEGETKITQALWKSHEYMHGRFWNTFLRLLLGAFAFVILNGFYVVLSNIARYGIPSLATQLVLLVLQPVVSVSIFLFLFSYFLSVYRDAMSKGVPTVSAVSSGKKAYMWGMGALGLTVLFVVPVLLAAYHMGASRNALQMALKAQNIQYLKGIPTRTFASHLFGIIFNYPASWSDATTAQIIASDPNIVAYFVHNDVDGYTKRFILRKFSTQETVTQFKAGYEAVAKKQGITIASETTVGGTYSAVVITTVPAKGSSPAYQEAHDVVAFSGATLGSKGMFTIDFYDKAATYLTDLAAFMGPIASSMTGSVPAFVPSTHAGR